MNDNITKYLLNDKKVKKIKYLNKWMTFSCCYLHLQWFTFFWEHQVKNMIEYNYFLRLNSSQFMNHLFLCILTYKSNQNGVILKGSLHLPIKCTWLSDTTIRKSTYKVHTFQVGRSDSRLKNKEFYNPGLKIYTRQFWKFNQ